MPFPSPSAGACASCDGVVVGGAHGGVAIGAGRRGAGGGDAVDADVVAADDAGGGGGDAVVCQAWRDPILLLASHPVRKRHPKTPKRLCWDPG